MTEKITTEDAEMTWDDETWDADIEEISTWVASPTPAQTAAFRRAETDGLAAIEELLAVPEGWTAIDGPEGFRPDFLPPYSTWVEVASVEPFGSLHKFASRKAAGPYLVVTHGSVDRHHVRVMVPPNENQ